MIKPLRLARVAARAEVLVLKREAAGIARRVAFALVAAVFLMGVLIIAHVIGYLALRQYAHFAPIISAAILLGVDLVITIIFGLLAGSSSADPVLVEARRVRDQSLDQARQSLTLAAMVAPVTRIAADTGIIRMAVRLLSSSFRRTARAVE
jgi:hypothetical protein